MTSWLLAGTALACALVGGAFYAFSTFVMPALSRVSVEEGIRIMQRINIDVYHWTFMGAFFLTPLACIVTAVQTYRNASGESVTLAIVGCLVYVIGNFLVTAVGNVPLNNALAELDATGVDAASGWPRYVSAWTRWNHVRTVASILAAAFLLLARGPG